MDQKQRKKNKHFLVLVICPKNIIGSWEDELRTHLTDYNFYGSLKAYHKATKVGYDSFSSYTFVVINYEQARSKIDNLLDISWDFAILDESHRIKNRRAKTTKAIWQLNYIRYKLILSGTPITKNEVDLWSQFKFLKSSLWGNHFKAFEKEALVSVDMGDYKKLRPHKVRIKKFMKKASKFTYYLRLNDMVDMPSKHDIPIYLNITGKHRKAYNELENNFYTEYGEKKSNIDLSVTSLIRLQQLTGGHLILDNNDAIRFKDQPKLWWIIDKLEDLGKEKVLIICRFTYEIELIKEALTKLKYNTEVMVGGMTPLEIKRVRHSFQSPRGCQILIGQVSVVKEGNNFQSCRNTFFYSKSLSYVDIDQCKRRTWRNGQKKKVMYYHLIIKNSIDESIESIVDKKMINAEEALMKLVYKRRNIMAKEAVKKTVKKATPKKDTTVTPKKKGGNLPKLEMPEFGVAAVAKGLGVDERSARLKLRNAGVEKTGRTYDFKNQTGVDKIVKQLSKKAAE